MLYLVGRTMALRKAEWIKQLEVVNAHVLVTKSLQMPDLFGAADGDRTNEINKRDKRQRVKC